jgi:hypothetical protein
MRGQAAVVVRGGRTGEAKQQNCCRGDGDEYPLHG